MYHINNDIENNNEIDMNNYFNCSFLDTSFNEKQFELFFSNEFNPLSEINTLTNIIPNNAQENNSHSIMINIDNNHFSVEKKKLGRKRKSCGEVGSHDKYSEDNVIRKSKKVFSDAIFDLINSKIKGLDTCLSITINNKKYKVEKLLNLGQNITKDISVERNLALFKQKIKNILYTISEKYTTYPKNYNMAVINELCTNENYKEIGNILNLDYIDCLKYYRGDKKSLEDDNLKKYLKGLELKFDELPEILEKEGHDKSYEEKLINTIKNIDQIYVQKKPRKKRKNNTI